MKKEQPKINIERTIVDNMVEGVAIAGALLLWVYPALQYHSLPDIIPVHFNAAGLADGYGSKSTIWLLPAVCTVITAMLLMLSRIPHILNYPVSIDQNNAEKQYRLAIQLLRFLSISIVAVFFILEMVTITSAKKNTGMDASWMLPAILLIMFIPLVFFIIKMFRTKNQ